MSLILTNYLKSNAFIFSKKVGCCLICCLRFSGANFPRLYESPKTFFSEITYLDNRYFFSDSSPCIVCLGTLQLNILKTLKNKVLHDIKTVTHDCNVISFSLSMPLVVQVREKAVILYLLQELHLLSDSYDYDKKNIPSIRDVWKWLSPLLIEGLANKNADCSLDEPVLTIDMQMSYLLDKDECQVLFDNYSLFVRNVHLKYEERRITKNVLDSILNTIDDVKFKQIYSIPPRKPVSFVSFQNFVYKRSNIFLGGRYIKLSRRLCQTPWLIEGESKLKSSVQQLICSHIIQSTGSESFKFLSSGREDVDVRMLGTGRPFAIELVNPKVTKPTSSILYNSCNLINNSTDLIKIGHNLKIVTRSNLQRLKEGEQIKTKTYRVLCICEVEIDKHITEKLKSINRLKVIQSTPLRVLHRRAVYPRERIIYEIRVRATTRTETEKFRSKLNHMYKKSHFMIFDVKAQAGTYIKEFVHGDFGRSFPNLCNILGHDIDIVALDVMDIDLQWP